MKLDWDVMIGTLAPNGRLQVVGSVLDPIPVAAFSLILQAAQHLGFADRLASGDRDDARLCCTARITPQTQHFPMSKINEEFARLESGRARYRIVLDAGF